mgnify:CR=1 FL=1
MARAVAPSALHDLLQELENPAPRVVQASLRQLLDVQDERYRRGRQACVCVCVCVRARARLSVCLCLCLCIP